MDYLNDIMAFLPGVIIGAAGLIVVLVAAYKKESPLNFAITAVSLLAALLASVLAVNNPESTAYSGMLSHGGIAAFGWVIILAGTLLVVLLSKNYLESVKQNFGEVYALILFATTGMLVLAAANDLIAVFIGLETMSICLYVLAGLLNTQKSGAESALKYFLLGAFSTGFFLYGIALIYGATGSTNLMEVAAVASTDLMFAAGVGLLLIGFLFKVSAVPFHMWTPDVYQGTATTLTAYFATASKAASFLALLTFLAKASISTEAIDWQKVLIVLSILTMVIGNIVAIVQDNLKRMLAYSSIAHAGYILVGLATGTVDGYGAVLFYLFAYSVMNIGAFGIIAYYEIQKNLDFTDVENYAGLGYKQPVMAVMLSIFLFSLAGIPPFIGFIGKYYIFSAAIKADLILLAVVGVLASAASVYYYLRVMVFMYFKNALKEYTIPAAPFMYRLTLIVITILTVYYGIEPLLPTTGLIDIINSFY